MLLSVRLRPPAAVVGAGAPPSASDNVPARPGAAGSGVAGPGVAGSGAESFAAQTDRPAEPGSAGEPAWLARAEEALTLLSARPGYVQGWVGRSPDEPGTWLLAAQFESAGACRRALSATDVRPVLWPLLADAEDAASTFEVLVAVGAGGAVERLVSDLAPDAAEVGLGRIPAPDAP